MEAKDLVNEVRSDFEERRNRRRSQESKWKLNIKFGNSVGIYLYR